MIWTLWEAQPLQAQGYAAGPARHFGGDPSYIIQCQIKARCPGGLSLGECPAKSYGVTCLYCVANHYDAADVCTSCAPWLMCVCVCACVRFCMKGKDIQHRTDQIHKVRTNERLSYKFFFLRLMISSACLTTQAMWLRKDSSFQVWPLVITAFLGCIVLMSLLLVGSHMEMNSRDSVAIILLGSGLVLQSLRAVPAIQRVEIRWVEPLRSLFTAASILTLNLDSFRPECWLGQPNPLRGFWSSILSYPAAALLLLCVFAFRKYVMKRAVVMDDVIHLYGLILSASRLESG